MARYGNLGAVSRPRGGIIPIGKLGPRQAHNYRNCYGSMSSRLSGYAGMLGAGSGPVTLANIRPAAAFGDVGAVYEGRAPMHGLYGGGKKPMPNSGGGGGGGGGPTPAQFGEWFNFGLSTAQSLGVKIPGQGGAHAELPVQGAGAGPSSSETWMYRPPDPPPKKRMSPWALAAIVTGVVLVASAGVYKLT
jgi:hypothetical protein